MAALHGEFNWQTHFLDRVRHLVDTIVNNAILFPLKMRFSISHFNLYYFKLTFQSCRITISHIVLQSPYSSSLPLFSYWLEQLIRNCSIRSSSYCQTRYRYQNGNDVFVQWYIFSFSNNNCVRFNGFYFTSNSQVTFNLNLSRWKMSQAI